MTCFDLNVILKKVLIESEVNIVIKLLNSNLENTYFVGKITIIASEAGLLQRNSA